MTGIFNSEFIKGVGKPSEVTGKFVCSCAFGGGYHGFHHISGKFKTNNGVSSLYSKKREKYYSISHWLL